MSLFTGGPSIRLTFQIKCGLTVRLTNPNSQSGRPHSSLSLLCLTSTLFDCFSIAKFSCLVLRANFSMTSFEDPRVEAMLNLTEIDEHLVYLVHEVES